MRKIEPSAKYVNKEDLARFLRLDQERVDLIIRQDPTFPRPLRLSSRTIRYDIEQLNTWRGGQREMNEICHTLGDLLSSFAINITDPLQATSGVYLLYQRGNLLYVGQSTNVYARIPHHKDKPYDKVLFLPCSVEVLDVVESALIAALRPKMNGPPPIRSMRLLDLPGMVSELKRREPERDEDPSPA